MIDTLLCQFSIVCNLSFLNLWWQWIVHSIDLNSDLMTTKMHIFVLPGKTLSSVLRMTGGMDGTHGTSSCGSVMGWSHSVTFHLFWLHFLYVSPWCCVSWFYFWRWDREKSSSFNTTDKVVWSIYPFSYSFRMIQRYLQGGIVLETIFWRSANNL